LIVEKPYYIIMTNLFKYLTLSILLCIITGEALGQSRKKKDDKKDEKKKEYPKKASIWQLDDDYSVKEYSVEQDTSLHLFHVWDPNDKKSISVNNLGNTGSPYQYNIFDDRMQAGKSPFFFMDYMSDCMAKPEDTKFYQVNHPYTWLYYACTPKARNGQMLDFTHTQNPNKKFNWGFNIKMESFRGRYSHQHMRNVGFTPQMSYTGKHLQIHFFYNFNKMSVEENGGVVDSVEIRNNRFTTKLESPFSNWGMRSWNLVGEYSVGKTDFNIINDSTRIEIYTPRLAAGYAFQYSKIFRTYEDNDISKKYYDNYYRSQYSTFDSLFYHKLSNRFHLKICENKITPELRGVIGIEHELYYNFRDYMSGQNQDKFMGTYFEGGISKNKTKNLILSGKYRQYMTGYKSGDMIVNGKLGFKIYKGESDTVNYEMKASVDFRNEEPTYFEKHYYSNNYKWDNNFSKTKTIRAGGEIAFPRWNLRVGGAYYLIDDFVYINDKAVPAQMNSPLNVLSLSVSHDLHAGPFHMANRATIQKADDNGKLCLPNYALYNSTYFQFYLVKNVLLTQLGGEVRFSGEYNALGYSPATSLFYQNSRIKAGNYPIINGFANIKIHGVLMFFKWEHIDGGLIKDWYAATDCYPLQDFHFMFGILWRFGD